MIDNHYFMKQINLYSLTTGFILINFDEPIKQPNRLILL